MGHRMSSLPIAEFCGQAPRLAEHHGAGRAAFISSAFHAMCAGEPDVQEKLARLTDDEREQIKGWHMPHPFDFAGGHRFDYSACIHEAELTLRDDDDNAVSVGHADAICRIDDTVYVLDLKMSLWTMADGPDNLQNWAYAMAAAQEVFPGATSYRCGLFSLTEGKYSWGEHHDLEDLESLDKVARVLAAATNDGGFATGPHCSHCWQRFHCPEYLLPADFSNGALAPLTRPGGLTHDNALEILLKVQAAKTLVDKVEKEIKEFARREGGISDGNGKVYRMVEMSGRESVSVKKLRDALGVAADEYITEGKPYQQARWVKA